MLYIFDKDGTVCRSKSGSKFINSVDDQELFPDVLPRLLRLKKGDRKVIATNQGGIAFDIMSQMEVRDIVRHSAQLIGASDYIFCPHHPDGKNEFAFDCDCRKPKPGMILSMMNRFSTEAKDTLYIGDFKTDREAAFSAGVDFVWAYEFFDRLPFI